MAQIVWYDNNDMVGRMTSLQSSTMGSTEYLNDSTGLTLNVWSPASTDSTSSNVVVGVNAAYVTGTNGQYDGVVQSTAHSMDAGDRGMAIFTLDHSGLDSEWRVKFWVKDRGSS